MRVCGGFFVHPQSEMGVLGHTRMTRLKIVIPLLLAAAVGLAAILVIVHPWGSGQSDGEAGDSEGVLMASPSEAGSSMTAGIGGISSLGQGEALKAPELVEIAAWINSEPLELGKLRGKVLLVDFWTYTCVNCLRTFPYLKLWHSKYADDGLVIIGVHSPEFSFERKLDNVRKAVRDNGIGWPVALDNDKATWGAYENRIWPAKYLIDSDGNIRYTHFGEGAYSQTEHNIRVLLKEAGVELSGPELVAPEPVPFDFEFLNDPSAVVTRELFAGWKWSFAHQSIGGGGYVGNSEYSGSVYRTVDYQDSGDRKSHLIYLHGPWYSGQESLRHARETSNYEDYIVVDFAGRSANAVIKPEGDDPTPFRVLATLDGEYLTDVNKGDDVIIAEDGRSLLHVDEPRMYSIVQVPRYGSYELKLSSNSSSFTLYSFTFGVYQSGS